MMTANEQDRAEEFKRFLGYCIKGDMKMVKDSLDMVRYTTTTPFPCRGSCSLGKCIPMLEGCYEIPKSNLGTNIKYQRVGFEIPKWHTCVQKSGKSPTPPPRCHPTAHILPTMEATPSCTKCSGYANEQSSHVPHTTWLINKQIKLIYNIHEIYMPTYGHYALIWLCLPN